MPTAAKQRACQAIQKEQAWDDDTPIEDEEEEDGRERWSEMVRYISVCISVIPTRILGINKEYCSYRLNTEMIRHLTILITLTSVNPSL
jgi:hypothetical protein